MKTEIRPGLFLLIWAVLGLTAIFGTFGFLSWEIRIALVLLVFIGAGAAFWLLLRTGVRETPLAQAIVGPVLVEPEILEPVAEVLDEMAIEVPSFQVEMAKVLTGMLGELNQRVDVISAALEVQGSHKAALQSFSSDVIFIKENVLRAFEISDNLANTAKQAFDLSEKVQSGVKVVTESLDSSLKNTQTLFEQSKQISRILEIMADVSEKIHILSINASIVSARAGTSGKGFEIVAKEIRNLAKETENSLKEIENVISELQGTISDVIGKVKTANTEALSEKDALISVAGSLQGVILAVEIIRAVTGIAKDKTEEQSRAFASLESAMTGEEKAQMEGLRSLIAQWIETYKL